MLYLASEPMTRSRGNIALPCTTVAGATPFTRTSGESSMASSRTRWFAAALEVSYATEPFFATAALAEVVRTSWPLSPCSFQVLNASSPTR
jgi:hypothetical protein